MINQGAITRKQQLLRQKESWNRLYYEGSRKMWVFLKLKTRQKYTFVFLFVWFLYWLNTRLIWAPFYDSCLITLICSLAFCLSFWDKGCEARSESVSLRWDWNETVTPCLFPLLSTPRLSVKDNTLAETFQKEQIVEVVVAPVEGGGG